MKVGKVDEINEFCQSGGGSSYEVIDVVDNELGNAAGVHLDHGLFNKLVKKARYSSGRVSAHGYRRSKRDDNQQVSIRQTI